MRQFPPTSVEGGSSPDAPLVYSLICRGHTAWLSAHVTRTFFTSSSQFGSAILLMRMPHPGVHVLHQLGVSRSGSLLGDPSLFVLLSPPYLFTSVSFLLSLFFFRFLFFLLPSFLRFLTSRFFSFSSLASASSPRSSLPSATLTVCPARLLSLRYSRHHFSCCLLLLFSTLSWSVSLCYHLLFAGSPYPHLPSWPDPSP